MPLQESKNPHFYQGLHCSQVRDVCRNIFKLAGYNSIPKTVKAVL